MTDRVTGRVTVYENTPAAEAGLLVDDIITAVDGDVVDVERTLAAKYFRHDLVRGPVRMAAGDDRVRFANVPPLPLTKRGENGRDAVCFFGDALPTNVVRGRRYFVVESTPDFIRERQW